MKKGKIELISLILLCFVLTLVLVPGCGSSDSSTLSGTTALFNQARENMSAVESYRMTGYIDMEFSEGPLTDSMKFEYDLYYERKEGGEPLAKMLLSFPSQDPFSSELADIGEVEMYITEDRLYLQIPVTGEWVFESMDFSGDFTDMSQGFTPQQVEDMLEMADSVEVLEDNLFFTRYKLVLEPDTVLQGENLDEVIEEMRQEGLSDDEIAVFLDIANTVYEEMETTVIVEKHSGLLAEMKMKFEFDQELLEAMIPLLEGESPPEDAGMVMEMDLMFLDYGETFNLELPEGTEDAVPVEEYQELEGAYNV